MIEEGRREREGEREGRRERGKEREGKGRKKEGEVMREDRRHCERG